VTAPFERVLNWTDENPTLLTILGGFGAVLCGIELDRHWGDRAAFAWGTGVLAFIALPAASTRRNRLQQGRQAARAAIRRVLETCAVAFGHPGRHVRANIMLVIPGGKRRRVDRETAFNMKDDPDSDLEIDATAGVSGEAFAQRKPAYGDLALGLNPAGPSWGLHASEKVRVRQTLCSILSVPVFNPDAPNDELVATLQVDSDLPLDQMRFDDPAQQQLAERFADVAALMLSCGE
jgi:hypothetical protein